MSGAGWGEVWKLVLAIVAHEPIPVQLFFALGAAFFAVMFLEGVYASFLPVRYATLVARKFPSGNLKPLRTALAPAPMDTQTFQTHAPRSAIPVRAQMAPRNLKRQIETVSRHRPLKPQINRVSMINFAPAYAMEPPPEPTEELPVFSPLPPHAEASAEV